MLTTGQGRRTWLRIGADPLPAHQWQSISVKGWGVISARKKVKSHARRSFGCEENPMPLESSFATALRALRSKRNITQRGFADTTSRTYLSKLESGKSSITLDKSEQLSDRLELSPLALLTLTVSEDTGVPTTTLISKLSD